MRILNCLLMLTICLFTSIVFAAPPTVHDNLQVMTNATPAQCSNWKGQIGPEENSTASIAPSGTQSTFGSPGVRTCTGCAVTPANACVCKTCYDYTDGF